MITKDTVLVLGAGASMPFGLPSGRELVGVICYFLRPGGPRGHNWIPDWLHKPISKTSAFLPSMFSADKIASFLEHLDGEASIDAFLEHQEPEFVEIGKACIAAALLPFERESSLFYSFTVKTLEKFFTGEQSLPGTTKNWYALLWTAMEADFDKFQDNKLRIVTFNYDRSLEHYLFTRLKRRFPGHEKDAEYAEKMPEIVHIHGRLSHLPWQKPTIPKVRPVPYDAIALVPPDVAEDDPKLAAVKGMWLEDARKQVTVIHEDEKTDKNGKKDTSEDTEELKQAKEWIRKCERLYFLGFAYHEDNLDRLKIWSAPTEKEEILGTTLGLSREGRDLVLKLIARLRPLNYKIWVQGSRDTRKLLPDCDVYTFLHDHVNLSAT